MLFRSKITDLHIKDRIYGGGSVPLGSGNVNFSKILELLFKNNYKGIIIFQAFRDDEGIEIFKKQYKKYSIVVKLTDRYEITEIASYISCPSPSTPLFSCKLCRKYHRVTYLGEKFCPILNKLAN